MISYKKIRRRIRDLVAIFLAMTVMTIGFSIYRDYQQTTDVLFKDSQSQVRFIAEHASRTFGEVDSALDVAINKVLKPEMLKRRNEKELYDAFLSAHKGTPQVVSFYFADNKGRLEASSLKYPINKFDLSDRDHFQHHRDTPGDEPYISRPYRNRLTNNWNFVFSQRISNPDGSFAGIVAASIDVAYFESLYSELIGSSSRKISLIRDDGLPIVTFPLEDRSLTESIKSSSMFFKDLPHTKKGVYREKDGAGSSGPDKVAAYFRLSKNYPLVACIAYDWNDSIAAWKRDVLITLAITVLFSCLAIVLTRLLMSRLTDLEESEEQGHLLSLIVEQSPVSVVVTDSDGKMTYVNPQFCRLTGYTTEEAIGENPRILKTEITSPELFREMWTNLVSGQEWIGELCNKKKDGSLYWEMAHLFPVYDSTRALIHYAAVKEDITERKRAEEELIKTVSLLNATLESTADGILVVDVNGGIVRWNQKFVDLWRIPEELLSSHVKYPVLDHIASQAAQPEEYINSVIGLYNAPENSSDETIYLADGRIYRRRSTPQKSGDKIMGRVWSFDDITGRKQAEKALEESHHKLETLSITDGLTGIANRRHFEEVLAQEYRRHARSGAKLSMIMLDIDHFKEFNDTYGHVSGDECLRQIARVLDNCAARPADLAARYGGEEFTCILPETDLNGAVVIAEKMRAGIMALAIPHKVSGVAECVTASLGVTAVQCIRGGSAVDIVVQADELLYRAKSCGRNRVEFFAAHYVAT